MRSSRIIVRRERLSTPVINLKRSKRHIIKIKTERTQASKYLLYISYFIFLCSLIKFPFVKQATSDPQSNRQFKRTKNIFKKDNKKYKSCSEYFS